MSPLGLYIRSLRTKRGWSLSELSRQSNVPYGTLRNIEQNPNPVKSHERTIRAVAAALEEKDTELMFALAGYGIPISQTETERNHSFDSLFASNPEWRAALEHARDNMTPEQQKQLLQVMKVFIRLNEGD